MDPPSDDDDFDPQEYEERDHARQEQLQQQQEQMKIEQLYGRIDKSLFEPPPARLIKSDAHAGRPPLYFPYPPEIFFPSPSFFTTDTYFQRSDQPLTVNPFFNHFMSLPLPEVERRLKDDFTRHQQRRAAASAANPPQPQPTQPPPIPPSGPPFLPPPPPGGVLRS
ncbi:hypothetical protein PAPYR_9484 [Paratrimastix pyriformis]|uniref:Uncharacterized protein n=1 Tax=Paratrimastix pyriformis TaxID=342808 RepID=A0ABQ8UDU4_9EUKA|nr:hypothetical protein PAPYR_9484 [Paratrimastix pyriformis]